MKKILLVGSQHGDERLGDKLIRRIKLYHPSLMVHVDFYLANPKAHRLNKRYIESDMNRSFSSNQDSYEAIRAKKLLAKIKASNYDLVLDLHTTTDKTESFFIVPAEHSETVNDFLKISPIIKIVAMRHKIIETSLIGNVNHALSVEASIQLIDKDFLELLIESLEKYLHSDVPVNATKELFYVDMLIDKESYTPAQFQRMKNFERFEYNFYPILIRSRSYRKYTNYRGFGATIKLTKSI